MRQFEVASGELSGFDSATPDRCSRLTGADGDVVRILHQRMDVDRRLLD